MEDIVAKAWERCKNEFTELPTTSEEIRKIVEEMFSMRPEEIEERIRFVPYPDLPFSIRLTGTVIQSLHTFLVNILPDKRPIEDTFYLEIGAFIL